MPGKIETYYVRTSGMQRGGGERGDGPGHPRQGGIQ